MQLEGQGNPAIGIDGVCREIVPGARTVATGSFDTLERLLPTIAAA